MTDITQEPPALTVPVAPHVTIDYKAGTLGVQLSLDDATVLAHVLGDIIERTALSRSAARIAGIDEETIARVCHVDGFEPPTWRNLILQILEAKAELVDQVDVRLMRLEPSSEATNPWHPCPAGCGKRIRGGHLMCAECWRRVPAEQRRQVYMTLRAGREAGWDAETRHAWHQAREAALDCALGQLVEHVPTGIKGTQEAPC